MVTTDTLLYKEKGKLQRKIIKIIATQGKTSKIGLEHSLKEHHHPVISRAVKSLVNDEYLKGPFSSIPRHRGRPEQFYEITDKTITFFINHQDTSLEDFWKMIFQIYDTSNKFKTQFSIDKLFRTYEVNRLGLKREHTLSYLYQKIPDIDFISNIKFLPEHNEVLEILALKGILTEKKIKQFLKKLDDYTIPKVLFDGDFLIMKINDKELPKYRLTLLGVQFFVYKHLKEYSSDSVKKMDVIKNNYGFLLQKILPKWEWLERFFTKRNLLDALVDAIDLSSHQQPFQTNKGIQEILDSHRNLSKVYDEKIENEHKIGSEVSSNFHYEKSVIFTKYKKFDRKIEHPQDTISRIQQLLESNYGDYYNEISKLIPEIDRKQDELRALLGFPDGTWNKFGKDLNEQILGYEEIMGNNISFRFYCILTSWIQENEDESLEDWIEYLKRDKDLMPWFSNWLQEINEFERENQPLRENFVKSFL